MTRLALPRRTALALALAGALTPLAAPADAAEVTVFAAASLKTALDEIAADWGAATGNTVTLSYAGTPQLAQQIAQGAPAHVFIAASTDWMDRLAADGLIDGQSRRDLLGNSLVLVASGPGADTAPIDRTLGLADLLGDGRLAMAMVDSVPAGIYGKEALTALGLWEAVEPKVAQAENVRAALALVTTGEAPYGIVYASDAVAALAAGEGLTVVGAFPAESHAPIVFPAALVAANPLDEAAAFLDHLSSAEARTVFKAQGFTVPTTE